LGSGYFGAALLGHLDVTNATPVMHEWSGALQGRECGHCYLSGNSLAVINIRYGVALLDHVDVALATQVMHDWSGALRVMNRTTCSAASPAMSLMQHR
jgi:hypothetical protein